MKSALFDRALQAFLTAEINWSSDTIKAALIDLNDIGTAITGATNATPIVVAANSHGLSNGNKVLITGVAGNTAANGVFYVANVTTNTFELQTLEGETLTNVAGTGAYTSGGIAVNMTGLDFLNDVSSAIVGTAQTIGSKSVTNGVADGGNVTFTAVTGDQCEALLIYKDTGTPSTSVLIALMAEGTGLPVTPSGGDITVSFSDGANKIFRLR